MVSTLPTVNAALFSLLTLSPCVVAVAQSMSRSSRMLNYINYRMRVTIQDG